MIGRTAKKIIKNIFKKGGYDIVPIRWTEVTKDARLGLDRDFLPIYETCKDFTMTSIEKMHALYRAVNYLETNKINGAFVECGVAAGGSMMLAAQTLLAQNSRTRAIWLYDTFEGMPEPTTADVNYRGDKAFDQWRASQAQDHNEWCYFALEDVQTNMLRTGYPSENLRFVKGKVEDTIPSSIPDQIALLRLDTDWYKSTIHELTHLYPRLISGGVLIIDDYGHWEGCRKATDEFIKQLEVKPLLNRIDRLGVIAIKP